MNIQKIKPLLLLAPILMFMALLLTDGHLGVFFEHRASGSKIYANMWEHFAHGDTFIDSEYCGAECFYLTSRLTTVYFGALPSILRGLADVFGDPYRYSLSGLSLLLAVAVGFLGVFRAVFRLGLLSGQVKKLSYLVLVAMFASSPLLYLMAWDWVYHEPILWGVTLSLVFFSTYLLWVFKKEHTVANSLILGFTAGTVLMCRPTTGLMVAIPYAYLALRSLWEAYRVSSVRQLKIVGSGLLLCFLLGFVVMTVNYSRWGNPLTFLELERNFQFITNQSRLDVISAYGEVNPMRIGSSLAYYFVPNADNFSVQWPFLTVDRRLLQSSYGTYDYVEANRMPLTFGLAFFLYFAVLGLRRWHSYSVEERHYLVAALLGGLAVTLSLTMVFAVSLRYSAEFAPPVFLLVLLALIGIQRSKELFRLRWWHYALLVFTFYTVLVTTLAYKNFIWEQSPRVRDTIAELMMPPAPRDYITLIVAGKRVRQ